MPVAITAFYASLLALFYVYLSFMVIAERRQSKVSLGDGGEKHLMQMMRVHGNFAEYVPFALLLMMLAELNGVNHLLLHTVAWWLIIARGLHAYGLRHHYGVSWQRFVSVLSTFLIYLVLVAANLLKMYGII